jgi:hypothetical protein
VLGRGGAGGEVSGEAMGRALAALERHGAAGANGAGRHDFTMTVEAATPATSAMLRTFVPLYFTAVRRRWPHPFGRCGPLA